MKILFQIVRITVGFTFLSFGIALTKIAGLGMDPWGLLHEGMDNLIPFLDFGEIIVYSGIFIMIISVILFTFCFARFFKNNIQIHPECNTLLARRE